MWVVKILLGWGCERMEILGYIEKSETLYVRFNTKYIWDYKPVTKEMYKELINLENTQEKLLHSMVRKNQLVGTIKEVNNDN